MLIPVLLRERPDVVVVPDAVVVMDNLAAHKAGVVRRVLDMAGVGYRCLPACSPDMNPIELAWSKLKTHLRARAARTRDTLECAIPEALATITPATPKGGPATRATRYTNQESTLELLSAAYSQLRSLSMGLLTIPRGIASNGPPWCHCRVLG